MFADPTFWVAVSLFGLVAVLVYFKLPALVAKQLDQRSERIAKELEEAHRLREEAQALAAEYQRKLADAVKAAEAILEQAKADGLAAAEQARAALELALERRQALALTRIEQAEVQALKDVREATIDAAIAAARAVMAKQITGPKADELIDASIRDLRRHLN